MVLLPPTTRLAIGGELLETVTETKLLGTVVTNNLKWDKNTENIVKKANKRMELLRRIAPFGTNKEEMKNLYILYIRSLLEQSCVVWHSGLTLENSQDLERVQKTALKLILKEEYNSYESALKILDLESLSERREWLCLQFARKCKNHEKMKELFPENQKSHEMVTRFKEIYQVNHANTKRLQNFKIRFLLLTYYL